MPALIRTEYVGKVEWLGIVRDRKAHLQAEPVKEIKALFSGPEGEAHGGLTRPSCSRVLTQYPRGTTIRNTRQFSILSQEELDQISRKMGLDAALNPSLLGATMVISGIPDFTHLPPSSRLQAESGATLVVDMENRPCTLPARPIEERHSGFGAKFKSSAVGLRGVTAWVEREGELRLGQSITLHIPDQRPWSLPPKGIT
ncbi:MOSC domain-containing protein [Thioclava sp. FR2]|uniref:MOSC domain-containing protein n=1 Tax=Thioclava sp. FR2 TaxID=3445780 RepID=UPI003EBA9EE6